MTSITEILANETLHQSKLLKELPESKIYQVESDKDFTYTYRNSQNIPENVEIKKGVNNVSKVVALYLITQFSGVGPYGKKKTGPTITEVVDEAPVEIPEQPTDPATPVTPSEPKKPVKKRATRSDKGKKKTPVKE